ncbi:hypothetical protein F5141DRAFT_1202671 [Pisolithus sp. B1]|nr:hypothetical protein F5141DRAFT_1202671 [Pisolithus sp. B1]
MCPHCYIRSILGVGGGEPDLCIAFNTSTQIRLQNARCSGSFRLQLLDPNHEEWEYANLPDGSETGELQWVTFTGESSLSTLGANGEERRESMSTQNSGIDPQCAAESRQVIHIEVAGWWDDVIGGCLDSRVSMPLDLRKPFILNLGSLEFMGVGVIESGRQAHRRVSPLELLPSNQPLKRTSDSSRETDEGRKGFLSSSLEPPIPAARNSNHYGPRGCYTGTKDAWQSMLTLPLNKVVGKELSMLAMMNLPKPSGKYVQSVMY